MRRKQNGPETMAPQQPQQPPLPLVQPMPPGQQPSPYAQPPQYPPVQTQDMYAADYQQQGPNTDSTSFSYVEPAAQGNQMGNEDGQAPVQENTPTGDEQVAQVAEPAEPGLAPSETTGDRIVIPPPPPV